MSVPSPYCGVPPLPGELLTRFNFDPILLISLAALAALHVWRTQGRTERGYVIAGWFIAGAALVSPLCALSVSLFSARIAQHMILLLVAAPLIALGWTPVRRGRPGWMMWLSGGVFLLALWGWHMPVPYEATFTSTPVYWAMHVTLFGSGVILWRELLHHSLSRTTQALAVGLVTSMHMGLLGAVLALASHPLFYPHLLTTAVWGLTPLQDQQLGGILMWVPGLVLFLWAAIRSLRRLWGTLEGLRPA